MINVLLVEDNKIVRSGLSRVLSESAAIQVCGQAENGLVALNLLRDGLNVEVIVADLNTPVMDGFELIAALNVEFPKLPVVIHTMHDKIAFTERALKAGAKGYILKSVDVNELFKAITVVAKGGTYYPNR